MGMQCYFNIKDIPNFSKVITYDYDLESYTYIVHSMWIVDCNIAGNAWFDCGSYSEAAIARIKWLIGQRVPFRCS